MESIQPRMPDPRARAIAKLDRLILDVVLNARLEWDGECRRIKSWIHRTLNSIQSKYRVVSFPPVIPDASIGSDHPKRFLILMQSDKPATRDACESWSKSVFDACAQSNECEVVGHSIFLKRSDRTRMVPAVMDLRYVVIHGDTGIKRRRVSRLIRPKTTWMTPIDFATIRFVREWNCEYSVGLSREMIETNAIVAFRSGLPSHFHCRLKDWFDHKVENLTNRTKEAQTIHSAADLANRAFMLLEMDPVRSWREVIGAYARLLDRELP